MKAYQLKKDEVFVIGVLVSTDDEKGRLVSVTKSTNQVIDIASGIWAVETGAIYLEVWNYKTGREMDVELGDVDEWEREEL